METAGAQRAALSDRLTTAYGRGLLSEHTLSLRLESLLSERVVDPEALVGDLCLRRPEETLRGRLAHTVIAARRRVGTFFSPEDAMPRLLALDWSSSADVSELSIGRAPDSDVRLEDPSVSRRHARLRCHAGRWALEDLKSSNGTLLNGHAVRRCELRPGDELLLGDTRLRVD